MNNTLAAYLWNTKSLEVHQGLIHDLILDYKYTLANHRILLHSSLKDLGLSTLQSVISIQVSLLLLRRKNYDLKYNSTKTRENESIFSKGV